MGQVGEVVTGKGPGLWLGWKLGLELAATLRGFLFEGLSLGFGMSLGRFGNSGEKRSDLVQMSGIPQEDGTGTGVAVEPAVDQTETVVVGTEADTYEAWVVFVGVGNVTGYWAAAVHADIEAGCDWGGFEGN